jgi:hypothetical protein
VPSHIMPVLRKYIVTDMQASRAPQDSFTPTNRPLHPTAHFPFCTALHFTMDNLGAQLSQLTPEQRQAVMMRIKAEADQQITIEMIKRMTAACFEKCAGTSVSKCICLAPLLQSYLSTLFSPPLPVIGRQAG